MRTQTKLWQLAKAPSVLFCFVMGFQFFFVEDGVAQATQRRRRPGGEPVSPAPAPQNPRPYPNPAYPAQPYAPYPAQPYAPYPAPYPYPTAAAPIVDDGVTGLDRFYGQLGAGFKSEELGRNDPEKGNERRFDQSFSALDSGVAGWGPVRYHDFLFNAHYGYSQDWGTGVEQITEKFMKKWFSKPTADNFIFPTKSMVRTHELVADLRYATPMVQAGFFARLSFSRTGSSLLGSKAEVETAQALVNSENFVPYLSFRYGRVYQGEVAMPFRTEINHEDTILSNKTYDYSTNGRGRVFSGLTNHRFYLTTMHSYLFFSAYMFDFKFGSLQQDRTRLGSTLALDFPVVAGLRAVPKFGYYQDEFSLPRIRQERDNPKITRKDNFTGFGLTMYYDFSKRHRTNVDLTLEITDSPIDEHKTERKSFIIGYTYSYPSTTSVTRKTKRFADDTFADDF